MLVITDRIDDLLKHARFYSLARLCSPNRMQLGPPWLHGGEMKGRANETKMSGKQITLEEGDNQVAAIWSRLGSLYCWQFPAREIFYFTFPRFECGVWQVQPLLLTISTGSLLNYY